jgi:hypothetical protein
MKAGVGVASYTSKGLLFEDGTTIDADVICWCTGFDKDVRPQLGEILGRKVSDQLHPVWGLSKEGEIRGVWRYSGHDQLYLMGGETMVRPHRAASMVG